MLRIELEAEDVEAALMRLGDALERPHRLFNQLGELLAESTQRRMERGVTPDGSPFAPKSQATIDAYQKNRKTPVRDFRPLFGKSRRLHDEITYVIGIDGQSVEIGSNMVYAAVHQFGAAKGAFGTTSRGAPIPWGDIPARPFLGLDGDDETGIIDMIDDYLSGAWDGNGGV